MQNKKLLLSFFLLFLLSTFVFSINGRKEEVRIEEPLQSAFKDKNLATFGNSITASKSGWAYKICKELEFGDLYNGALGGAVWGKRIRETATGKQIETQNYLDPDFAGISNGYSLAPHDQEVQKRINNCAIVHIQKYLSQKDTVPVPDYIILSYGTNDVLGKDEKDPEYILDKEELEEADLISIAGAVRWSVETLRTEFPEANIYIVLPLQSKSTERNRNNLKKIEIIKKVCDNLSVTYFDCFAESGITQENELQFLRDGLHPNEEGNLKHTAYIIKKLKEHCK